MAFAVFLDASHILNGKTIGSHVVNEIENKLATLLEGLEFLSLILDHLDTIGVVVDEILHLLVCVIHDVLNEILVLIHDIFKVVSPSRNHGLD